MLLHMYDRHIQVVLARDAFFSDKSEARGEIEPPLSALSAPNLVRNLLNGQPFLSQSGVLGV